MNVSFLKSQPSTANLSLWLDAAEGVTKDGTNAVSSWVDQSVNFYVFEQTVLSKMPFFTANSVNKLPAITFDGINDVLKSAIPVNQSSELTFFLVSKCTRPNLAWDKWKNTYSAVSWQESSWGGIHLNTSQEGCYPRFSTGVPFDPDITPLLGVDYNQPIPDFTVVKISFIHGWIKVDLNGVNKLDAKNVILGDSISNTTDSVFIGEGVPVTDTYFPGEIAELLMYKGNVDEQSMQQTENYLLKKYGFINGVNDQNYIKLFSIYPNPAKDELQIKNDELRTNNRNPLDIQIINLQGKVVLTCNLKEKTSNFFSLDISPLESGMYLIKYSNDHKIITEKFVKE